MVLSPIQEFFAKIEWEGSVSAALEYGLYAEDYDLPREMAEEWNQMRKTFRILEQQTEAFEGKWEPTE